jgi:hypothetical protein
LIHFLALLRKGLDAAGFRARLRRGKRELVGGL